MELSPEERQRIYEEEKARHEAQARIRSAERPKKLMLGALGCMGAPVVGCLGLIAIFGVLTLVGAALGPCLKVAEQASTKPAPVHDDLTQFLSKYALPDSDDTTAYDEPRPPMVTRWLVYRRERVRVTYVADARVGDPPPYTRWKLMGFQDSESDEVLTPSEAVRRLTGRRLR